MPSQQSVQNFGPKTISNDQEQPADDPEMTPKMTCRQPSNDPKMTHR